MIKSIVFFVSLLFCCQTCNQCVAKEPSSSFAVVTLSVGEEYTKTVYPGLVTKRAYCERHGYFYIEGHTNLNPLRPIPWSKIQLVLEAMDNFNCEWIFWTDADSLIMNPEITLDTFVDNNHNFILSRDFNDLNSGRFFIRNCEWSRKFLLDVYNHTECINHGLWENLAIITEYENKEDVRNNTLVVDQRLFNSYPKEMFSNKPQCHYQQGDFIIHFPSVRGDRLKSLMLKYSKKALP